MSSWDEVHSSGNASTPAPCLGIYISSDNGIQIKLHSVKYFLINFATLNIFLN